jgi:hypothetical protein
MRKHLLASAALAVAILAAACGGSTPSSTVATAAPAASACVNAKAAHKAYLVVTHQAGASVQKCVGFDTDQLSGEDLMKQSGVQYQTQTFSFGKGVCQIDNEPTQFTECFPKDQPYWALFTASGTGPWTGAQVGFTQINLKAGDAMGWRYTPATASPAPTPAAPKE